MYKQLSVRINVAMHEIVHQAKEILLNVYGLRLIEVNDMSYILVNNIKYSQSNSIQKPEKEQITTGLLLIVLAVIFMNQDEIDEGKEKPFGKHPKLIFWNLEYF